MLLGRKASKQSTQSLFLPVKDRYVTVSVSILRDQCCFSLYTMGISLFQSVYTRHFAVSVPKQWANRFFFCLYRMNMCIALFLYVCTILCPFVRYGNTVPSACTCMTKRSGYCLLLYFMRTLFCLNLCEKVDVFLVTYYREDITPSVYREDITPSVYREDSTPCVYRVGITLCVYRVGITLCVYREGITPFVSLKNNHGRNLCRRDIALLHL